MSDEQRTKPGQRDRQDFLVLSRPAQLRALAQQDRLDILRVLSKGEATGAQIASQLGLPANRVHYHLKELTRQGLTREVKLGRKRWKEERFYAAVAHHLLVDPSVGCADTEAAADLARAAEKTFIDWRRREILNIDLGVMAQKIVVDCLRVRAGERVLLMFQPPALELAEAIAVELEAQRARPIAKLWSRHVLLRTLDRHTPESLASLPFLDPVDDASLDAIIYISTGIPQGAPPNAEQLAKLPHRLAAVSAWQQSIRARGTRYIEVSLPHRAALSGFDWAVEQSLDAFWRCLDADYGRLRARAGELLEQLGGDEPMDSERELVLAGPGGSELIVRVDLAHPHVSDGILSDEDLAQKRSFEELPAGSVALLPVRGFGDGTYAGAYAYLLGRTLPDVRLELREGRIVAIDAPEGAEFLRRTIAEAAGEPDRISEVRIGINGSSPPLGLSGWPSLDGCLAGVVTLGFGNNELRGGDVRSTLDLGVPSRRITVSSRGREILRGV